jgi:hypothetical protein
MKWIVQETGEVRFPLRGEVFFNDYQNTILSSEHDFTQNKYPILSVTPLPTREEMDARFCQWFSDRKGNENLWYSMRDSFMACYDLLLGPQPTPETAWLDDWM